ncbi:hypothetical protein EYC84_006380 [Monilinia fructicola]|uniref:Uncharacterized protein n=1 Tax=Monilinia fructicola TaxID=38448 RepID=A0A5M9K6Y4_MONFR|nr:hypothetical protein EYC84_006380 [Monilinia fructicola]
MLLPLPPPPPLLLCLSKFPLPDLPSIIYLRALQLQTNPFAKGIRLLIRFTYSPVNLHTKRISSISKTIRLRGRVTSRTSHLINLLHPIQQQP